MKNEPNRNFVKKYRESNRDVQIAVHRDFDESFHLYAKTHWAGFNGLNILIPGFFQTLLRKNQWFLRKASINFHMKMTLGQGQEMTLTFNIHNIFINLISWLRLPAFRSQAAIVTFLKKNSVFL